MYHTLAAREELPYDKDIDTGGKTPSFQPTTKTVFLKLSEEETGPSKSEGATSLRNFLKKRNYMI